MSLKAGASKKKGNKGERDFANWLSSNGIKASRDPASGGGTREKSDIVNNINANFEVKTVKKLNLKEAWNQTDKASSLTHNTPYLVIHFDGMGKDEWLMVMNNYDWLDLISRKENLEPFDNAELKFPLLRLRTTISEVLKNLPK